MASVTLKIGATAADAVLGGGAAAEMGLTIVSTGRRWAICGDREALLRLADEYADRGCSRGEGWDSEPSERAACRRAAAAIRKACAC